MKQANTMPKGGFDGIKTRKQTRNMPRMVLFATLMYIDKPGVHKNTNMYMQDSITVCIHPRRKIVLEETNFH